MRSQQITIGSRQVGHGHPCYFIAEIGVNHNGSMDLALQLIDAAVAARADAVKFQAFDPSKLVTEYAPQAEYQTRNLNANGSQKEMLEPLVLSPDQFRELRDYSGKKGIDFLCTPFDEENAALVVELGCNAIKVGSGDLSNHLFLVRLARHGLPLILSTGMADEQEVRDAIRALADVGNKDLLLLHCVSNYPADPKLMNLRVMERMAIEFNLPVGLSDHTLDDTIALVAVSLGAAIVEKHLTLNRKMPGPDHAASLQPEEFAGMIARARIVEAALGDGIKRPVEGEEKVARVARRSLAAAMDLDAGIEIQEEHLITLRPAGGLPPAVWRTLLGRRTRMPVFKGVQFEEGMLE